MMERKFCNHCGRLYTDICPCRKNQEPRRYTGNAFYNTKKWKAVSEIIKNRDYRLDRIQLYFTKYKATDKLEQRLYDFAMDAQGVPRKFSGRLIVHHVEELTEAWDKRFSADNLITINYHMHEYIHMLYKTEREAVQAFLKKVIEAELP